MRSGYLSVWLATLAMIVVTCQAQPPRGGIRNRNRTSRDTLFRLLEMPAVRKELGLRSLQIQMLDDLQADLAEQRRAAYANNSGLEFPRGQREPAELDQAARERFDAVRTAVQKTRTQGEQLIAVILDGKQTTRLHQLRLQNEGTRALDRQEFREQLQVSDDQFRKIQDIRRAEDDPSLPRIRRQKKLDQTVLGVLSQEQQVKFKELQGDAFEFPLAVPADLRGLRGP